MESLLEDTSFDVILIGTGPVQSVVAAALARIGRKILHLDPNGYYGGCYGTLQLQDLITCVDPAMASSLGGMQDSASTFSGAGKDASQNETAAPPASAIPLKLENANLIHSGSACMHIPRAPSCASPSCRQSLGKRPCYSSTCPFVVKKKGGPRARLQDDAPIRTWVDVTARSRQYNLDLIPKVCFSRGDAVQLLISSNIGRYLDFKVINNTYMYTNGEVQEVPCSKQTLLLNKHISPKDKRSLVKFLQFCSSYDEASAEFQDHKDKPFSETMDQVYKLNESLQQFIVNAMAFVARDVKTSDGLAAVRKYLSSLGVYGSTSFLYPVYGAGELSQAFCRLSAVYGGIYVLRSSVSHLLVGEDGKTCTGVYAAGQTLNAKFVVAPSHILTESSVGEKSIFRGLAIVENPLHGLGSGAYVISFPAGAVGNSKLVKAFVLGSDVAATPKNQYVIQLVAEGSELTPEQDLRPVIDALLAVKGDGPAPRLLWTGFFAVRSSSADLPESLHPLEGSLIPCRDVDCGELSFDELVKEAEGVFRKICPTEEYLPSAPNPEDIVWGGGDDDATTATPEPQVTAFGTKYYPLEVYEEGEAGVLQLPEGFPSLAEAAPVDSAVPAAAPSSSSSSSSSANAEASVSVVLPEAASGDSNA